MLKKLVIALALAPLLSACVIVMDRGNNLTAEAAVEKAKHPEARLYDKNRNAKDDVDAALAMAEERDTLVLLVMGANWCHDSRGLAGWFEKPRFQALIEKHYELVFVDVGQRDRNIDIAQRFGLDEIVGTPTVLILTPAGKALNLDTAPTWRNAASRTEDEIFEYFEGYANQEVSY